MILLVVWDGLRPDMISPERTPYLASMAEQGVFCSASHAVFPSATRINSAALTTGCYPGRHGLVDNELYVSAVDPFGALSCADWRALQRVADAEGGRLLTAPTIGEALESAGKRMVSAGSGSPGTTYLTNPTLTGPVVNWAVHWTDGLPQAVAQRLAPPLGPESESVERTAYVIDMLQQHLIPQQHPDLITLWLTEPDHAQHYDGLKSANALAMLADLDRRLRDMVAHLQCVAGPEGLTCFVLSDHGFDTVAHRIESAVVLDEAGFGPVAGPSGSSAGKGDVPAIVLAGQSLHVRDTSAGHLRALVRVLASQPWVGGVFVRDDLVGEVGGMPQSAVGGSHQRSAPIIVSMAWDDSANEHGVPGSVWSGAPMAATHGSASPYALNNTLVAWGTGIKQGVVSSVPCGIVDVAPTALRLLGVTPIEPMDGRVLDELLVGGPDPANVSVSRETAEVVYAGEQGDRRQVAHYSVAAGKRYLDKAALS